MHVHRDTRTPIKNVDTAKNIQGRVISCAHSQGCQIYPQRQRMHLKISAQLPICPPKEVTFRYFWWEKKRKFRISFLCVSIKPSHCCQTGTKRYYTPHWLHSLCNEWIDPLKYIGSLWFPVPVKSFLNWNNIGTFIVDWYFSFILWIHLSVLFYVVTIFKDLNSGIRE